MREMEPMNTWLSAHHDFVLNDNTNYLASILQAIPLTLALKALHSTFHVELMYVGESVIRDDEASFFSNRIAYSREVLLCLNQEPVVWARSVCALENKEWQTIMQCGTQPLGMRLYELPLQRTEFECAYLSPQHHANPSEVAIVSRRSCFYLQDAPLLLIESFLPELKSYLK